MDDFSLVIWATAVLFAWLLGEFLVKIFIPRIVCYSLIGFLFGEWCRFLEWNMDDTLRPVADIAMGSLLCELGFRANPRWIRSNPWVLLVSMLESVATFVVAFAILYLYVRVDLIRSSMVASICIATSPGAILRITRNGQSSGPLTNSIVNLTALNCVVATILFKVISGIALHADHGAPSPNSGIVVFIVVLSVAIAISISIGMKWLMRPLKLSGEVRAFGVAISVLLVTLLLNWLRLSPVLGALAMGFAMRHLGIKMTGIHQDFGSLGRTLNFFLYVYIGTKIELFDVWHGLAAGLIIGLARAITKIASLSLFAPHIGLHARNRWLLGIAMLPASAFVVCLLEQAKWIGIDRLGEVPSLVAMLFLFEILGPLGTSVAIAWSKESLEEE